MNKTIISGHLVRDNELKYLPGGTPVLTNAIATTKKWKDKNTNEIKEKTMFIDIVLFRGAETFNQWTFKGSKVLITGSIELDQWQDSQTQQNRQKHKINVEEFEFLGTKQDNQTHNQPNQQMQNDQQYQQNVNQGQDMMNDRNGNSYIPDIDIDNDQIPH